MHTVLIFRERLLAPSETFILEQAQSLRHYRPILVGLCRTEPRIHSAVPEILLRHGLGVQPRFVAKLYRYTHIAPSFFRRLSTVSPSILHAHFATDAIQALPIAETLGLPLVVSLHGCDVTPTAVHFRQSFSGRHYLSHKERLFTRAAAFLCVSGSIREAALKAGFPEEKLHVHYTGVDCERFRPVAVERDSKLILFVGRLVEKKGCEYLLHAMALLQGEYPAAHLEIIGDGPLRAELEALARKLNLRVHFRGVQDSTEVQRSMARARVLCNPSVTAKSGDMEGFGMVFAEAQAIGTPVVSSIHAAIPEAVSHGETGLLCPEREPRAIAEALLRFLRDDTFWSSTSEHAVRWVHERFDIALQSRKLEMIYDACVERNKSIHKSR